MRKIITITDPMQVKIGDKAYFKECDYGFTVIDVDERDAFCTLKVNSPLSEDGYWAESELFEYATRKIKEPEWPDPHDAKLHVYLGADGRRYIYYPITEIDMAPSSIDGTPLYRSRESMEVYYRAALPLTELKLVQEEDDDNEQ